MIRTYSTSHTGFIHVNSLEGEQTDRQDTPTHQGQK